MTATRIRVGIVGPIALSLLGLPAFGQAGEPLGKEFEINTNPNVSAGRPAVTSDAAGNFVVVWEGFYPFPYNTEVFARRYDAQGHPLSSEDFRVNTTPAILPHPAAASDAVGNFVVVWMSAPNLLGQRFDRDGDPLGGEFQVNTALAPLGQAWPAVASAADGSFVVVWKRSVGSSDDLFGRRFDADGNPLGGEFQVARTGMQSYPYPDVAVGADGDFVVVWQSASGQDVFGQRYDASGNPLGGQFQVNTYTTGLQHLPAVAADASADFVVVWVSRDQDGDGDGIFGRGYDASGIPLGEVFQVNTYTTNRQSRPDVSSDASGAFTVVWDGFGTGGSGTGVFAREYDADGTPRGGQFPVNPAGRSDWASVALDDAGEAVIVYERIGVFGQRYAGPSLALSVDGSCPGLATVTLSNAPPSSEVAVLAAANTNGFVKGGRLCPGTELELGEPFQLPPTFVIVDGEGRGSAQIELEPERCWLGALALADCTTSNAVLAPPADD